MTGHSINNPPYQDRGKFDPGRLRLYVARGTPNSSRAEHNLQIALRELPDLGKSLCLEVVDVFLHARRAAGDGVIVTPTLIGRSAGKRHTLLGDLSDGKRLRLFLITLSDGKVDPFSG
jgi:hypothetical protein